MLSKVKSQLDELTSKVGFLDSVKKYLEVLMQTSLLRLCLMPSPNNPPLLVLYVAFLQVLSVDQWGLDASLLPCLAVCGSLDLQSSGDPSVLSFGTSNCKCPLQAGSPLGLMAHLYARYSPFDPLLQQ